MTIILHQLKQYDGILALLYSYLNFPYLNVLFDKISLLKPSIGIFMLHSFPKMKYMYMYWYIIMFTCL